LSNPIISVLFPVFNPGLGYLEASLQSILAQSCNAIEVILINDGCDELHTSLLRKFSKQDGRIRLEEQSNAGLSSSLEKAWQLSCGTYIGRMDGDDISDRMRFEKQVRFLEAHPGMGACGTYALMIDPDGDPVTRMEPPLRHEEIEKKLLEGHAGAILHPTLLVRREVMTKAGGYKTPFEIEDLDLYLRLSEVSELANVPEELLQYRVHMKSTNHLRRSRHRKIVTEVVEAARSRRGLPSALDDYPVENRLDDPSEVYFDWAFKAAFGRYPRTARKHARNGLKENLGTFRSWMKFIQVYRLTLKSS